VQLGLRRVRRRLPEALAQRFDAGHRLVVPEQRAARVDRQRDGLRLLGRCGGRGHRQVEADRVREQRRGDDEDDQQHQHDVDQRRRVDLGHRLRVVA